MRKKLILVVGDARVELATNGLRVRCSTNWANPPESDFFDVAYWIFQKSIFDFQILHKQHPLPINLPLDVRYIALKFGNAFLNYFDYLTILH